MRPWLALLLVACRPAASEAPRACDGTIADAAWLAGAWKDREGARSIEERWTSGAGGMMLGVGRTLVDGRVASFEFMRIEARPDGLVFVGQPSERSAGSGLSSRRSIRSKSSRRLTPP